MVDSALALQVLILAVGVGLAARAIGRRTPERSAVLLGLALVAAGAAALSGGPHATPDDLARGVYLSMSGSVVALIVALAGIGLLIASHLRSKRLDALEREWRDELSDP